MRRSLTLVMAMAVGGTIAATAGVAVASRRWAANDETDHDPFSLPDGRSRRLTTDDGAWLSVVECGDTTGPTVVLAHCWTGTRATWAPVARRLCRTGHHVVLYDHRGHGESTVGDDGITVARLGTDLRCVLESLDLRHAVLAGHSMGGIAVQSFVVDHPEVAVERVRGLALVATAAGGLGLGPRYAAAATRLVGSRHVEWMLGRRRLGPAMVRGSVGRRAALGHLTATGSSFLATPADVRVACLDALLRMDLHPTLTAVSVPTVVAVGRRDTLTPPRLSRRLAAGIGGARLEVIPDAGHMLPLEEPDRIADLIRRLHA
jgi:pimeloyl-ACP methyl ester carboxylesterase